MSLKIIAEIISKTAHCEIEEVQPDVKLTELGLSSLDTITMLFDLEEAFDVEIPNEVIPSIITVNDILEHLKELDNAA